MSIETERLNIRPLMLQDADFIFKLLNTKGWLEFIGDRKINNVNSANDYINKILSNEKFYYNVFEIKQSRLPIGIVTFLYREEHKYPDIGFAMLPNYEKNGYAFEAARAYLNELIKIKSTNKIIGITKNDNYKSINLLNKLGLIFESNFENNKESLNIYSIEF